MASPLEGSAENAPELEPAPNIPPMEDVPGGSVPLHVLCDRCQKFVRESKFLDFIQNSDSLDLGDYPEEKYTLCTMEQLLGCSAPCHLCKMILIYATVGDVHVDIVLTLFFYRSRAFLVNGNHASRIQRHLMDMRQRGGLLALDWDHVPRNSGQNISAISTWIRTCRTKHETCQSVQNMIGEKSSRPKRILDLSDGQVRIRCDVDQISHLEYLTLSHMWGSQPSNQLRLLEDQLEDFQKKISYAGMPHIYADAIRVTRTLGFRFLWIDSLCIIQDSEEDWRIEASKMAAVYGNALCNLSYIFPPEDAQPRLRYDPWKFAPCILRRPVGSSPGIYISPSNLHWEGCDWLEQDKWPLLDRAWVMQERLMCPRTVYLGNKHLVWECPESYSDELLGEATRPRCTKSRLVNTALGVLVADTEISGISETTRNRIAAFGSNWEAFFSEYATRKLTRESDRVMGLAGIAKAMHKIHGLTYLAGLWKEYLVPGLLWRIGPGPTCIHRAVKHTTDEKPSWSWLSMACVPEHQNSSKSQQVIGPEWRTAITRYQDQATWAEFVSFQWPSQPTNNLPASHFYDIKGVCIRLVVRTTSAILDSLVQGSLNISVSPESGDEGKIENYYYPDDLRMKNNSGHLKVKVAVIVDSKSGDYQQYTGLVLVPDNENGDEVLTWRRIGLCYAWLYDDSIFADFDKQLVKEEIVLS